MTRRFAIYFAPPEGSALEAFGRHWLGRDHVTGEEVEQPAIDGTSPDDLKRLTRSARHYGFHATLKAPFVLADDKTADQLHRAAESFAKVREGFVAPPLRVEKLSRYIALTLSRPCPEIDRLAADCVSAFEPFRAPLTEHDIDRRRQSGLTPKQEKQLLAFGYPYIFENFHFHMTLAGSLDPPDLDVILKALKDRASPLEGPPLQVDAIAIYEQPDRDRPFSQTARFPFQVP